MNRAVASPAQELTDWVQDNLEFVLFPWTKQRGVRSRGVAHASGSHFWDHSGEKFLDLAAQLVNLNLGHQHPRVVQAIVEQAQKMCYVAPAFSTEPRGRLARLLAEVTPPGLKKTFFTTGGAESNEFAIKIAKLVTGRPKVLARHRSYHGSTAGAFSLTGDHRRAYNEPGVPGVVHLLAPYCFRCPFGNHRDACCSGCVGSTSYFEEVIRQENPDFIAAVVVESITGPTNGLYVPPPEYLRNLKSVCDRYGILLIVDEVMSGWGRTGRWFGFEHYGVVPDIVTTAKGITNGMVPLGAVIVSDDVAAGLEDRVLWSGLTYSGHTLACAAGVAAVETLRDEGLVERAEVLGRTLRDRLRELQTRHQCVGDVRAQGLFTVMELVADRRSNKPLSASNRDGASAMQAVTKKLTDAGVYTMSRPNLLPVTPPLNISEEDLNYGLDVIDEALTVADQYTE